MTEAKPTTTVTALIGNSDDKLSQAEWSEFVHVFRMVCDTAGDHVHFFATSNGMEPWQNACCVVEVYEERLDTLMAHLTNLRQRFKQDSCAITVDKVEFI